MTTPITHRNTDVSNYFLDLHLWVSYSRLQWIDQVAENNLSLRRAASYLLNGPMIDKATGWVMFGHDVACWCNEVPKKDRTKFQSGPFIELVCERFGTQYKDFEYRDENGKILSKDERKVRLIDVSFIDEAFKNDRFKRITNDHREGWFNAETGETWVEPQRPQLKARYAFQWDVLKEVARTPFHVYQRNEETIEKVRQRIEQIADLGSRRYAQRGFEWALRVTPLLSNPDDSKSRRLYDRSGSWGSMPGKIKRAMTRDWRHLDLRACHYNIFLAICDRELTDSESRGLLGQLNQKREAPPAGPICSRSATPGHVLSHHDTSEGGYPLAEKLPLREPLKRLRNLIVYGMGKAGLSEALQKLEDDEVGVYRAHTAEESLEALREPRIVAMLELRRRLFAQIKKQGHLVDAYGHKVKLEGKPSTVLSVVCETYEFAMLRAALPIIQKMGGYMPLWEHDGISLAHDDDAQLEEMTARVIEAVNARAQVLNIPTELVEKYKHEEEEEQAREVARERVQDGDAGQGPRGSESGAASRDAADQGEHTRRDDVSRAPQVRRAPTDARTRNADSHSKLSGSELRDKWRSIDDLLGDD